MASTQDDSILQMALVGYTDELRRLEERISEIRSILGIGGKRSYTKRSAIEVGPVEHVPVRKRRRMSKEARKRIGEATRARWAALREAREKPSTAKKPKARKRPRLSSAERHRISGGQAT